MRGILIDTPRRVDLEEMAALEDGDAVITIGVLVLLVTRARINAFICLVVASLIVGAGAVSMGQQVKDAAGKTSDYTMLGVMKSVQDGMGSTLGGIAAVLGLGTMLGRLLAESGGAEVLAKRFSAFFGPKRIQWCIMALALAVAMVGTVIGLVWNRRLTIVTLTIFIGITLPFVSYGGSSMLAFLAMMALVLNVRMRRLGR